MLVAVSAVAIIIACNASNPNAWNTNSPAKNGTTTPKVPTVNDAFPPRKNSFGVISNPAINKITIAPISPNVLISGPICRIDSPVSGLSKNAPNANGPIIIPASNSPSTIGSLILLNNSPISFAAANNIPTAMMTSMNPASAAII